MTKLISRSQLIVGTNLTINEVTKTFTLIASVDGSTTNGLIAKDGVSLQALYSKFVELWASVTYQDSPFPMYALDSLSGQYQFGTDGSSFSGWKPADDTTRQMLRDGGWSEFNAAGALARQYVGIVGLGTVNSGAQLYYQLAPGDTPANFVFTDQANQGVQVFGSATADATTTTFDKRTFLTGFCREYGKIYKTAPMAETGKTATGAFITNLLLSNSDDLKIQANDAAMSGAPYSSISVSYYSANQTESIGGSNYNFKIVVNGAGATLEQIYTKIQYLLRQNSNINTTGTAGVITGKTAGALMSFSGDTLTTSTSVYIDNLNGADINRVVFTDDGGTARINPYVASGTIAFNAPLVGAGSSYRLMYTAPPGAGNDFGEAGAITVNDASGTPITGVIGTGSISFTFDYDGNTQGGFSAGTDRPVTLVGIRPGSGKYVATTGILTRSKSISLALVAEADRIYL